MHPQDLPGIKLLTYQFAITMPSKRPTKKLSKWMAKHVSTMVTVTDPMDSDIIIP